MTLRELNEQITLTVCNLKNHGLFPKENNIFDYKTEINFHGLTDPVEVFT